mmetsp:Transcript_54517/g.132329  ORF Transcript_54517/g.132329 Transcript_54517/m.132329 type:complete len:115 (-) Transcript_54517:72-416(-)
MKNNFDECDDQACLSGKTKTTSLLFPAAILFVLLCVRLCNSSTWDPPLSSSLLPPAVQYCFTQRNIQNTTNQPPRDRKNQHGPLYSNQLHTKHASVCPRRFYLSTVVITHSCCC